MKYINLSNYNSAVEMLKKSNEVFKEIIMGKIITITSENGEEISFQISPQNLPHLLGIKSLYFRTCGKDYESMYHFFERFLSNSDRYFTSFKRGDIQFGRIFNTYVCERNKYFYGTKLDLDTIEFFVKTSKKSDKMIDNFCDYLVFFNTGESYSGYILGLKFGRNLGLTPLFLEFIEDEKALKDYFEKHKIKIVSNLQIVDKSSGFIEITNLTLQEINEKKKKYASLNIDETPSNLDHEQVNEYVESNNLIDLGSCLKKEGK